MMLESKYDIGDFLFVVTDKDQDVRQVTGIVFKPTGVVYELSFGVSTSEHYEFELSKEPNEVLKVS